MSNREGVPLGSPPTKKVFRTLRGDELFRMSRVDKTKMYVFSAGDSRMIGAEDIVALARDLARFVQATDEEAYYDTRV